MTTHTSRLNKASLIEAVADELGVTHDNANDAINAVLDVIARTLIAGHDVTVTNFGTFRAVTQPARMARNPQTGERVRLAAQSGVRFRVSPRLREVVAAGDPSASIRKRRSR